MNTAPRLKVQVWIYRDVPSIGAGGGIQRQVLLLKVVPERGSYWQPVTGGVESSETLVQTAAREAREETHLEFKALPVALGMHFTFESRWGKATEHVFALQATGGDVKTDPVEHVEFAWVTPEVALQKLRFESNMQSLRILIQNWQSEM